MDFFSPIFKIANDISWGKIVENINPNKAIEILNYKYTSIEIIYSKEDIKKKISRRRYQDVYVNFKVYLVT